MSHQLLRTALARVDETIGALERAAAADALPALGEVVDAADGCIRALMRAYVADVGTKALPPEDADLLATFKVLVKGDPAWNAIRDNCRELVYYRNCIELGRDDALPPAPARMAVRLARHVHLYVSTRCIREGRVEE